MFGVDLVIAIAACSAQEVSTRGGVKFGSKDYHKILAALLN
jgi:hypothetical protein